MLLESLSNALDRQQGHFWRVNSAYIFAWITFGNIVHITHTHPFNGPLSRTTQVSRYQKGKTNLNFTEARDSEWQWHQLGHMQVCTSLQTDNHASTPPTNGVEVLKECILFTSLHVNHHREHVACNFKCIIGAAGLFRLAGSCVYCVVIS